MTNNSLIPESRDLLKFRILLYFNPPSLIFRKMPMEAIELVMRHQVDVLLNEFNRKHMSADIQMEATIRKSRVVFYFNVWKGDYRAFNREQLHEGLNTVK